MPVSVAITVTDPPAAPPGYTLCAFEVRSVTTGAGGLLGSGIAAFAGTTEGFEDAANVLVKAVQQQLASVGAGLRIAAVAWWVDAPLEKCVDGRERLVSVYDAGAGVWGEWFAEDKVQGGKVPAASSGKQQRRHYSATGELGPGRV